jgi:ribosomal-protein-alanine N-acetyltransferase
MTPADVPRVMELEPLCFPTPWSAATYYSELRNRNGSYWVVRLGAPPAASAAPPLLAYGGMWLLGEEAHITTFAVHPQWRRRHLGEWLLIRLLEEARARHVEMVTLEVRVGNRAAIDLYTKLGFEPVGLRKGYYHDTGEDARLLTLFGLDRAEVGEELAVRRREIEQGAPGHGVNPSAR